MQFNLAVCCFTGNYGVEKDLEKAIYWLSEAAANGIARAQYNLGYFYMNGIGVDIDEICAVCPKCF
jgi:TPR repeat protein